VEKKIYQTIDKMWGSPTIFKGYNASDRGIHLAQKYNRFHNPVAIGLDAKRFDQHVSIPALKWEHQIYQMFYPQSKYLSQLLKWQLYNRGYVNCDDGSIKYRTEGCRMSGDMNTSLGNCLLMSCIVHAYKRTLNIDMDLINDGDDCVVIFESIHLERFTEGVDQFFLTMGFKVTVEEPVYMLEHIEFCQSHPVFVDGDYLMVKNPNTAIAKTSVSLKPLDNPSIFKMWCAAVGEGGLSLTGGIPVWQSYYNKLYKTANGAKKLMDPTMIDGMYYMAKGMTRKFNRISEETRVSYYHAFGLMPDIQIALEQYYDGIDLCFGNDQDKLKYVDLPLGPLLGL
jgi:hypothetical protein